jgi:hypothetical protein
MVILLPAPGAAKAEPQAKGGSARVTAAPLTTGRDHSDGHGESNNRLREAVRDSPPCGWALIVLAAVVMSRPLVYAHDRVARHAWSGSAPGRPRRLPTFRPFLDPLERSSEILFGLVMVLAYTAAIDASEGGRESVRTVLIGAIGCNFAWAVIDAGLYLIGTFIERSRGLVVLRAIRRTRDREKAHRLIAEVIPPALADMLGDDDWEALRHRMSGRGEPSTRFRFDDYMAAAGVFLLVFASTFPVVLPFVFMADLRPAMRLSHAIAVVMLFGAGWELGHHAGRPAWRTGLVTVAIGTAFAGFAYVMGG